MDRPNLWKLLSFFWPWWTRISPSPTNSSRFRTVPRSGTAGLRLVRRLVPYNICFLVSNASLWQAEAHEPLPNSRLSLTCAFAHSSYGRANRLPIVSATMVRMSGSAAASGLFILVLAAMVCVFSPAVRAADPWDQLDQILQEAGESSLQEARLCSSDPPIGENRTTWLAWRRLVFVGQGLRSLELVWP